MSARAADDAYLANVCRVNVESFTRIVNAAFKQLSQQDRACYLMGCSAISTFIRIPSWEAYCASRDFQSALLNQLSAKARKKRMQLVVCNNETSVVWTDGLMKKLEVTPLTEQEKVMIKKMAFETPDFVRAVLLRMYAKRRYILMGKEWWVVRRIAMAGVPLSFPEPPPK